jgi:hypothetical protein
MPFLKGLREFRPASGFVSWNTDPRWCGLPILGHQDSSVPVTPNISACQNFPNSQQPPFPSNNAKNSPPSPLQQPITPISKVCCNVQQVFDMLSKVCYNVQQVFDRLSKVCCNVQQVLDSLSKVCCNMQQLLDKATKVRQPLQLPYELLKSAITK